MIGERENGGIINCSRNAHRFFRRYEGKFDMREKAREITLEILENVLQISKILAKFNYLLT